MGRQYALRMRPTGGRAVSVAATKDTTQNLPEGQRVTVTAGNDDLRRSQSIHTEDDPLGSDDQGAYLSSEGHGFFTLWVFSAGPGRYSQVAHGSWELFSSLYDRERSQVLYPKVGLSGQIVTVDFKNHRVRSTLLQNGRELRLLDQSRDGTLVAFSVYGPCDYAGSRFKMKPDEMRHVCIVKMK